MFTGEPILSLSGRPALAGNVRDWTILKKGA
jgi:hypothetical protein